MKITRRANRDRGMALIITLLVVAAAALFAMTMADRTRRGVVDTVRDRLSATAHAAASGGIEHARWALARDPDYAGETLQIGASDVRLDVTRNADQVQVVARAAIDAAPYASEIAERVEATLALRGEHLPVVTHWRE